jgi:hypothetical protein
VESEEAWGASLLNYLVLINAIDLLPTLFDEILTPEIVYGELQHSSTPELVRQWIKEPPPWLHKEPVAIELLEQMSS